MREKIGNLINNFVTLSFVPHPHPWDYVAHFALSFVGIFGILFFLKLLDVPSKVSFYSAVGVVLSLGIIKELIDMRLGRTDMAGDMTANILGLALASLIILFVTKIAN